MRSTVVLALFLIATMASAETDWLGAGKAWWEHVRFLSSDQLQGRQVGTKGYNAAADYVVRQFKRAGLAAGASSSYSQPVEFIKTSLYEPESSLALVRDGKTTPIKLGDEAFLRWASKPIPDVDAPLVFAGYGLDIPEAGYSDLNESNLRGAVVVYLAGGPANIPGNLRSHYSSSEERAKALKAAGALGSINILNPRTMEVPWARYKANRLQARMSLADPAFSEGRASFAATWNPAQADQLFEGSGHSIAEILDAADHNRPLPHFALHRKSPRPRRDDEVKTVRSRNVVGLRPGIDPRLKNEYVILSAHLDHLGVGKPVNGDAIFNGAMDDASGIASIIEIARTLQARNIKTKRSLLFLAVTGEEEGELGSQYFAERPTVRRPHRGRYQYGHVSAVISAALPGGARFERIHARRRYSRRFVSR